MIFSLFFRHIDAVCAIFPISLCLLLGVGYAIWCLYAVCSHGLLVQLVMCHPSAQIYLDVGHYPESTGRLWQQNYLLAQKLVLFASALIQNPSQSVCVSSSCSHSASEVCSLLCLLV